MKCSLFDIESLSAEIENLGNLGPERLDLNAVAWLSENQGLERPAPNE